MKYLISLLAATLCITAFWGFRGNQEKDPWAKEQLMPPAELAEKIKNNDLHQTTIFNIGPAGNIKGSIEIGATQEAEHLAQLKKELTDLPKDREVVIYCGCCPFRDCPNIRPAFELLKEMKFKNAKLLNLSKNLKVDWIEKGYPLAP